MKAARAAATGLSATRVEVTYSQGRPFPSPVTFDKEDVHPGQVSRGGAAPAEAVEGVQAGVQVQGC
jgi:hypothetical protein